MRFGTDLMRQADLVGLLSEDAPRLTRTYLSPEHRQAGEYLIACNEYCGVGHHTMAAKLHVVPARQWQAPAKEVADVR